MFRTLLSLWLCLLCLPPVAAGGEGPPPAERSATRPAAQRLGFYLHGCWRYEYPFAVRSWKPADYHNMFRLLKRLGFNTVGNWSEWEFPRRARFPYVRPMSFRIKRAKAIYRDFPDVYARKPLYQSDHVPIAQAFADRDAEKACALLKTHLRRYFDWTKKHAAHNAAATDAPAEPRGNETEET